MAELLGSCAGVLSWVALMYFSFTVLTSTGFGEITPATSMPPALRSIVYVCARSRLSPT